MFLLFINDLPDCLNDSFGSKLFADDLKAYDICNPLEGNDKFQHALNCLVVWSARRQLNLSVSKCGSSLIGGSSKFQDDHELVIQENILGNLNSVKTWEYLLILT